MADHSTTADPHVHEGDGHGDHHHEDLMLVGHDGNLHPAHLQHYFVSAEQQFESSKLGMWLFLMTEILLFGGMFVAYAIFRSWYPELFAQASEQLDTTMGAVNTLVLLLSSLTVAWAIRGAQTDNRKVLVWNLVATVVLASMFMVVKYFEYTHKFELGIFPGKFFVLDPGTFTVSGDEIPLLTEETTEGTALADEHREEGELAEATELNEAQAGETGELIPDGPLAPEDEAVSDAAEVPPADDHGAAISDPAHAAEAHGTEEHDDHGRHGAIFSNPRAGVFFSIYYVMTGIHGLHVLIGIIAISILAWKANKGAYTSVWYTPVENVGLYWHVVDIIWIFLFPLMYLI